MCIDVVRPSSEVDDALWPQGANCFSYAHATSDIEREMAISAVFLDHLVCTKVAVLCAEHVQGPTKERHGSKCCDIRFRFSYICRLKF